VKFKLLLVAALLSQAAYAATFQEPAQSSRPPVMPAPSPSPSPQRPDEGDIVRITTNLVQVDAVVTDKSGKVVTDLKPEEIEIYEDGRKQKVTNFQYYTAEPAPSQAPVNAADKARDNRNNPPSPPARLRPEDVRRTIALVVDDLGLSFQSIAYVRRALKKFVDEQMQPGDLVAIIRTSGGMGALQQFTSDKRQLYAAIERVKWNGTGRGGASPLAPLESKPPADPGLKLDPDKAQQEIDQLREEVFSVGTLGALSYVVRGLRDLPGRKSVLLVSDGFKIFNRNDRSSSDRVLRTLERLTDQANRASVVIYTMDARGLLYFGLNAADSTTGMTPGDIADGLSNRLADFFESQNGLNYLAQQTGGLAIRNTNDLSAGIKSVLADQRGFYLIGYRPDESTFDPRLGRRKFHNLKLKVTRPGNFKVRMRNGFYGVSDEDKEPAAQTLAQQLIGALVSPFGATGLKLQLTSLFANDSKGSFMRSVLHVDAKGLTFTDEPDGTHKLVFDVLAMTFGDNGVPVDQSGRTYTLKVTDEWYKRIQRDGLVYSIMVPIKKAGAYQLRMSLRDSASERIGSASQFVEVPDLKKDRLALSSLTLVGKHLTETPFKAAASSGSSASSDMPDEGLDKGNAEASPAVRHLSRGMALDYGYFVYNARLDKATNRPQVTTQVRLFRSGQEVFTGRVQPFDMTSQTDLSRLRGMGRILLGADLVPGEYVLQIIVTDALANEKHRVATQWMDFEIVR
jgi:VWFA-related protein